MLVLLKLALTVNINHTVLTPLLALRMAGDTGPSLGIPKCPQAAESLLKTTTSLVWLTRQEFGTL